MKIELILLGVIGLVFLVDFIKNSRKKPSIDNVVDQVEGGDNTKKNKKNINVYFLILVVFQIILNGLITSWIIQQQDFEFFGELWIDGFSKMFLGYQAYNYFLYFINILFIPFYVLYNSQTSLNYILKRKKNFTIYILSIPVIKVLIHFFIYTEKGGNRIRNYDKDLAHHIDGMFMYEIWLFIPSFILVSLVVWFFNDKIKAR